MINAKPLKHLLVIEVLIENKEEEEEKTTGHDDHLR